MWRRGIAKRGGRVCPVREKRMVEAWSCAPVTLLVKVVGNIITWNDRVHLATERICGGV